MFPAAPLAIDFVKYLLFAPYLTFCVPAGYRHVPPSVEHFIQLTSTGTGSVVGGPLELAAGPLWAEARSVFINIIDARANAKKPDFKIIHFS
jgi:hypothetical protein